MIHINEATATIRVITPTGSTGPPAQVAGSMTSYQDTISFFIIS